MFASGVAYNISVVLWYIGITRVSRKRKRVNHVISTIGHEQMSCNKHISAACVLFFFICFRTYYMLGVDAIKPRSLNLTTMNKSRILSFRIL